MSDKTTNAEIEQLHADILDSDPFQSRSRSDSEFDSDFEQLKSSIDDIGVLNPLIVRPIECSENYYPENDRVEYFVVSGQRRMNALRRAGRLKYPCKVVEMDDEEAARTSLTENKHRKDLSGKEWVQSVGNWYELLAEDLVGEDDEVECPECGKECSGRRSIEKHVNASHGVNEQNSFTFYLSENQIHKEMAQKLLGGEKGAKVIGMVIDLYRLPNEVHTLFVDDDVRSESERELLKDYGIKETDDFTSETPPERFQELARFNKALQSNIETDGTQTAFLFEAYARSRNTEDTIPDIKQRFKDWVSHVNFTDAKQNALDGKSTTVNGELRDELTPNSREELEEESYNDLRSRARILEDVNGNGKKEEIIDSLCEYYGITSGASEDDNGGNDGDDGSNTSSSSQSGSDSDMSSQKRTGADSGSKSTSQSQSSVGSSDNRSGSRTVNSSSSSTGGSRQNKSTTTQKTSSSDSKSTDTQGTTTQSTTDTSSSNDDSGTQPAVESRESFHLTVDFDGEDEVFEVEYEGELPDKQELIEVIEEEVYNE